MAGNFLSAILFRQPNIIMSTDSATYRYNDLNSKENLDLTKR